MDELRTLTCMHGPTSLFGEGCLEGSIVLSFLQRYSRAPLYTITQALETVAATFAIILCGVVCPAFINNNELHRCVSGCHRKFAVLWFLCIFLQVLEKAQNGYQEDDLQARAEKEYFSPGFFLQWPWRLLHTQVHLWTHKTVATQIRPPQLCGFINNSLFIIVISESVQLCAWGFRAHISH